MNIYEQLGSLPIRLKEPDPIQIGNASIGRGQSAFIVAEIGTSHNGNLDTAERLIEKAAEAGADCAKFQAVFAEEIVHPQTGNIQLPGGPTPLFEVFKRIEREADFYGKLKRLTESAGLIFLCTPFGAKSARILKDLKVDAVKIASPEINHLPLIEEVASWDVPVVLSTGVSTMADIELALSILPEHTVVLHCVTVYPAPEAESNLLCVPVLSAGFGKLTGISDHSLDPALLPALSVVLGGCVIEKHFTLDRGAGGLDDPVALTPLQFKELTETVRAVESMSPVDGFAFLIDRYSEQRISAVLGDGVKRPSKTECNYYRTTNRSIMAVRNIEEGATIVPEAVALLRSEKNLIPGLPPRMMPIILGKKVYRDIKNGSGVRWEDLLHACEQDGLFGG